MGNADRSDDSESEEFEDVPDSDEDETIDADEFFKEIQARRDEQRQQVSYEWCETIRDAGECYRELKNIDSVVEDLSQSEDDIREALTVYRLIFEEPPGTAAAIASQTSRAFFAVNANADETIDREDRDDSIEDLVREHVGSIYLEYDIGQESVGDPVDQEVPEHPTNIKEFQEMITEALSVPTSTLAAAATIGDLNETLSKQIRLPIQTITAATATDELNEVLAQQLPLPDRAMATAFSQSSISESPLRSQTSLMNAAMTSTLDQQNELLQAAMSPVFEQIAQQYKVISNTAVQSIVNSFDKNQFPKPFLADLAAIQSSVDAAAAANPHPSSISGQAVDNEVPTPATEVEPLEASSFTVPETDPIEFALGVSYPDSNVFSTELTLEIPTQITYFVLTGSETREWFVALPANYQRAVISGIVGSIAYSLTLNWGAAGFAATTLTPLIRQMLLKE